MKERFIRTYVFLLHYNIRLYEEKHGKVNGKHKDRRRVQN